MKNYENLQISTDAGIATVTINREKALNALNRQTMDELEHFFTEGAAEIDGLVGVILTGAGPKAFVAGADITEFLALEGRGTELSRKGHELFNLVENFHKPVIAAVNGFALGGGCELAMACHMRVAAANARFGQPEVNLGIIPGYGGTQRLVRLIGPGKATELMLTADMLDAATALQLGLVNYVTEEGKAVEKATEILTKVATKAPVAVSKVLECVRAYFDKNTDGFEKEIESFGETTMTEDFREGATAFVEKRKAVFRGF